GLRATSTPVWHRGGVDLEEWRPFGLSRARLAGLVVEVIFSPFAPADAVELAPAQAQVGRFRDAHAALVAAGHHPPHVHLANSAAVLATPDAHFTMVRPGIMLYGYAPAAHLAERASLPPPMRAPPRLRPVRTGARG